MNIVYPFSFSKPVQLSPVLSNLVLYYDPSNSSSYPGSGTSIFDLTANSLDGSLSSITFTDPYLSYGGTASTTSVPDNPLLEPGSGDWSVETWINGSVFTGSSRVILGKFDDGGASQQVSYGLRSLQTGALRFEVGNGTSTVNSPSYTLTTDTWYQVVGVWSNVASNSIALYINGVIQGSNSHSFSSILNSANPLYLGSYNGGEYPQWWNGKIGVVRLYSSALTSSEVLQNYNADKAKYGL